MSEILLGYALPCRDSVGGLKTVYFASFYDIVSIREKYGYISNISFAPGAQFLRFEFPRGAASYTTNPNSNQNGLAWYDENISLVINKINKENTTLLHAILKNTCVCIAQDRNNEIVLLGRDTGMKLSGGNAGSGAGSTDRNGYSFNLVSKAKKISHVDPEYFAGIEYRFGIFQQQFINIFE